MTTDPLPLICAVKVDNCGTEWPCKHSPGQENNTHCSYDHSPPTTFAELSSEGPPNCTSVTPVLTTFL